MQRPTIPDKEIPTADPEQLCYCFAPWVRRIALRYIEILNHVNAIDLDDLCQVGQIALLEAQKKYDPDGGASFLSFSFNPIRAAMRRELGFSSDGQLPVEPLSLDAPIKDDTETMLRDILPDGSESITDRAEKTELYDELHKAIERLKNAKQKEVITRCWLQEQDRTEAAADMGIKLSILYNIDREGRNRLRRDHILKQYAMPFFHVGVNQFRSTWTSATEAAAIWREEHLRDESR